MRLKYIVKNIIVVVLFLVVAYQICEATPYYINKVDYGDKIRLIIDDKEVTNQIKDKVLIVDDKVLLSIDTLKEYVDPNMHFSDNSLNINYDKYIVKMPLDENVFVLNDKEKVAPVPVKNVDGQIYVPVEMLEEIYDIDVNYNEKVIISTKEAEEYTKGTLAKNVKLKKYKRENGLTVDKLKKGETIEVTNPEFESVLPDEYVFVRTEDGDLGYIKKEKIKLEAIENELVVNGSNESRKLKDEVKIIDNEVMLSIDTIKKYINEYIYYDEKYDTVIAINEDTIKKFEIGKNEILVNDETALIDVSVQEIDDEIYVPLKEISELYNVDVVNKENCTIITTKEAKYYTFLTKSKMKIYEYPNDESNTMYQTKDDEKLEIFDKKFDAAEEKDFVSVRTQDGQIGYIQKGELKDSTLINSPLSSVKDETDRKISLVWEYAANYTPDRQGEKKINAINVVSPTWVYVTNDSGDIKENVSQDYIKWAKNNGYEVWPTIKNDDIEISETSALVTDMNKRKNFVNKIASLCKKYGFKGINLDFEYMYQRDRDEYALLVRELAAALKQEGVVTSVDVNVPDGSPNWSLCFDSKAISDSCDYIIVMAYDQYGQNSNISGPVASLKWVDFNLNKMVERDEIDSSKLILGVPFYSRYWKEKNNSVVSTTALSMEKAGEYINANKSSTVWDEELGQHVVSYTSQGNQIKIYVEDEKSLEKKVELIEKYNLAGVAAWRRGFETDAVWKVIEEATK